jgi:hypothetical protein
VFQNEIDQVNASLTAQLQHAPYFPAVFVPPIYDRDIAHAAYDALFSNASEQYAITKQVSKMRIACHGFNFLKCKELGRISGAVTTIDPRRSFLYSSTRRSIFMLGLANIFCESDLMGALGAARHVSEMKSGHSK